MHKNVFTSCVKAAHTLRENLRVAHILYAPNRQPRELNSYNHSIIRTFHTPNPTYFPLASRAQLPMFIAHLSTLCTVPISTITNLKI